MLHLPGPLLSVLAVVFVIVVVAAVIVAVMPAKRGIPDGEGGRDPDGDPPLHT